MNQGCQYERDPSTLTARKLAPRSTSATRRELAHRSAPGIEVSLFWSKPTDRVTLAIVDARLGADFEFVVDGRNALDAFYHPYAYLGDRAVGAADPILQAERP